jgi:phosphoglycolate phosphatase-like HAD superfamily hydrolase
MAEHPDAELDHALQWSKAVNAAVADIVHNLPPFPYVRESLELLQKTCDSVVVSATPTEALVKEWRVNDIDKHVRAIAGQELGTKKQHLKLATAGKYAPNHVLMVGDAPGDLEAARANQALFFPINPGREEESWQRFYKEGLLKFLDGQFAGAYEAALIAEFDKLLPSTPPWKR